MLDNCIIKLHSASRSYCIKHYEYWTEMYSELCINNKDRIPSSSQYTQEALNIFPRYNVLRAILFELEKYVPDDFSSLSEAKEFIKISGEMAETIFTKPPCGEIQMKVMEDERKKFCDYIESINYYDLEKMGYLFYRRTLLEAERLKLWTEVKKVWNIKHDCLYPIVGTHREDLIAFQEDTFINKFGFQNLRDILRKHGTTRVYELRELNRDCESDLEIIEPCYDTDGEGFWFSDKIDWLIFVSHEDSITIAGQWLIDEIKRNWNDWKSGIWSL